jgi:hypothetical protein
LYKGPHNWYPITLAHNNIAQETIPIKKENVAELPWIKKVPKMLNNSPKADKIIATIENDFTVFC